MFVQQSPVFSIKDLETAALAEQHVVNQAKLRNRASTFTMRAFPSDVDSVLTSPVAAGPGRMAPRRKSSPAKQYKRSTSNTDDRGQRSPDVRAHT